MVVDLHINQLDHVSYIIRLTDFLVLTFTFILVWPFLHRYPTLVAVWNSHTNLFNSQRSTLVFRSTTPYAFVTYSHTRQ